VSYTRKMSASVSTLSSPVFVSSFKAKKHKVYKV
jgi:hypothetical protein